MAGSNLRDAQNQTVINTGLCDEITPDNRHTQVSNNVVSDRFINNDGLTIVTRCWNLPESTQIR